MGNMKGKQFRERVLAVFAKHTLSESDYGAMTWFGKHCDATRRAVYRWCGSKEVRGQPLRILRILEAMPAGTPWAKDPELLGAPLPEGFPSAEVLKGAGFRSQADVYHALDADLLAVDGVGPAALVRIRKWWNGQEAAL